METDVFGDKLLEITHIFRISVVSSHRKEKFRYFLYCVSQLEIRKKFSRGSDGVISLIYRECRKMEIKHFRLCALKENSSSSSIATVDWDNDGGAQF